MLKTLSDDSKRQGLHARNRFVAVLAVCHHAGQCRHFSEPAAVVFAFDLDVERHERNVPSGLSGRQDR